MPISMPSHCASSADRHIVALARFTMREVEKKTQEQFAAVYEHLKGLKGDMQGVAESELGKWYRNHAQEHKFLKQSVDAHIADVKKKVQENHKNISGELKHMKVTINSALAMICQKELTKLHARVNKRKEDLKFVKNKKVKRETNKEFLRRINRDNRQRVSDVIMRFKKSQAKKHFTLYNRLYKSDEGHKRLQKRVTELEKAMRKQVVKKKVVKKQAAKGKAKAQARGKKVKA